MDFSCSNKPAKNIFYLLSLIFAHLIAILIIVGAYFMSYLIMKSDKNSMFAILPLGVAMFLSGFIITITKATIWFLFGKESLTIKGKQLLIKRRAAISYKNLELDLTKAHNLRIAPDVQSKSLHLYFQDFLAFKAIYAPKLGGRVLFDHENLTIPIGNLITSEEAIQLHDKLSLFITEENLNGSNLPKPKKLKLKESLTEFKIGFPNTKEFINTFAIIGWWSVWTFGTYLCWKSLNITAINQLNSIPQDQAVALLILSGVSIFIFFYILYSLFDHEFIKIKNDKKIYVEDVLDFHIQEELFLKPSWGSGSNKKIYNRLSSIVRGDSLKIVTKHEDINFGKGLNTPEAYYVRNAVDKFIDRIM